ncbi:hypothetical protein HNY73_007248 [Argiope bruennichi]|uniref:Uncharacterized protein n=1 Tax=Argiope bruennichi TaxID=94029 RepID=A0A8T0FDD5_ARGBR|nr:hypothetical protein HNY73_007248 [Argiope bruennichi]
MIDTSSFSASTTNLSIINFPRAISLPLKAKDAKIQGENFRPSPAFGHLLECFWIQYDTKIVFGQIARSKSKAKFNRLFPGRQAKHVIAPPSPFAKWKGKPLTPSWCYHSSPIWLMISSECSQCCHARHATEGTSFIKPLRESLNIG